jgi:hypothetical protein
MSSYGEEILLNLPSDAMILRQAYITSKENKNPAIEVFWARQID